MLSHIALLKKTTKNAKTEHHVLLSASQMKLQGDRSTPGRQSVSAVEMTSQRRSSISSQVGGGTRTVWCNILNNCVLGHAGYKGGG